MSKCFNYKLMSDSELAEILKSKPDSKALTELSNRHSGIFFKVAGPIINSSQKKGFKFDADIILGSKLNLIYSCAKEYNPEKSAFSTLFWKKTCWTTKTQIDRMTKGHKFKYVSEDDNEENTYDDGQTKFKKKTGSEILFGGCESTNNLDKEEFYDADEYENRISEKYNKAFEILASLEDKRIYTVFKTRYSGNKLASWADVQKAVIESSGKVITVQTCINLHARGLEFLKTKLKTNE